MGCFQYSPVEGAAANKLGGMVPDGVKEERWHRFMQLQAQISAHKLRNKVGSILDVIVDAVEGDKITCRSRGDAPEIDGNVFVKSGSKPRPGDIFPARITHSDEYDLWGERTDSL